MRIVINKYLLRLETMMGVQNSYIFQWDEQWCLLPLPKILFIDKQ